MKKHLTRILLLAVYSWSGLNLLAWQSDNEDGTYTNPPLYADFPDPDIIRVGEDFYFATTTFVNVPGLTILHSKDLVNWEYCSHVVSTLDGTDAYDMKGGTSYRGGVFAPSIRHHNGTFYVVVNPNGHNQNVRIYTATDPHGPWAYHELDRPAFDPGFFIDHDGTGYIMTSGGWDGTHTLLTLNKDYTRIVGAKEVHYNKGAEGAKLIKRGEWYYLFNSIPGKLALTVSRAGSLFGPWETRDSISDRTGGHQGAIVDLPNGEWYGFVMIDKPYPGRMTNISPIFWEDDWPIWGTPDAPNRVPDSAPKPIKGQPVVTPATSDDFSGQELGLQWQWNHNPDNALWSLSERPGWLRLKATQAEGFWTARNTLTQKGWGPWSRGTVALDLRNLKPGDICGFGTLGKFNGHIYITCDKNQKLSMGMRVIEDRAEDGLKLDERESAKPLDSKGIMLRTDLDLENGKAVCAYSLDGKKWKEFGGEFDVRYDWRTGTFQGPQFAVFCYNPDPGGGFVDVDAFEFTDRQ